MSSFQDLLVDFYDRNNVAIRRHHIILQGHQLYIAIDIDYRYTKGISCIILSDHMLDNIKKKESIWHNKITYTMSCIVVPPSIIDFLEPGSKKVYEELIKLI